MEFEEFPEDVLQFLMDHIDTVPQLETVMLIWESAPRSWTVDELARRVYVPADEAARVVQHLERKKLIVPAHTSTGTGSPAWAFAQDGNDAAMVARLAAVYRRHVVRVAQIIHEKASPGVLAFARAFQIKRDK